VADKPNEQGVDGYMICDRYMNPMPFDA
jgi:hypothetical protein